MRQRLLEGDTPARKAWIGAIIDRIEGDQGAIRIMGRKAVLEHAVASGGAITPDARTTVPRWRTGSPAGEQVTCLPERAAVLLSCTGEHLSYSLCSMLLARQFASKLIACSYPGSVRPRC